MIRSNLVASQLPLAREPRMWYGARDSAVLERVGAGRGIIVLLQ